MTPYQNGFNRVMKTAGLRKHAVVHPAIKQFRRALQEMSERGVGRAASHSTSPKAMRSILDEELLRTGTNNTYGKGVYFQQGMTSNHGNIGIMRSAEKALETGVENVNDPRRKDWARILTDDGTSIGSGDYLYAKEPISFQKDIVDAARSNNMRVIAPTPLRMAENVLAHGMKLDKEKLIKGYENDMKTMKALATRKRKRNK